MFTPETPLNCERLKSAIVDGTSATYSFGRKNDLSDHAEMMTREFVGKSQLELFHAMTIVFIRRKLNLEECVTRFQTMWSTETDFLCQHLDSRWLVAACDTIVDCYDDKEDVAFAIGASLFLNTVKLYETERLTTAQERDFSSVLGQRVSLFDGTSAFMVGQGDMVFNLVDRLSGIGSASVAARILQELVCRANTHDTVFNRFLNLHTRQETHWGDRIQLLCDAQR